MAGNKYTKDDFSSRDAQLQAGTDQNSVSNQLAELDRRVTDLGNERINLETDLQGLFETVSAVPTGIPKIAYDQIKIYVNGGTLRFYWYDSTAHVWHYVTATA